MPHRVALLAAFSLSLLAGCSGKETAPATEPPSARVAKNVFFGAGTFDPIVMVGDRRQLVAAAFDSAGSEIQGAPLEWVVDDTTIATISATGEVQALKTGTTEVRVLSRPAFARRYLTVVPRFVVGQLAAFPKRVTLAPGGLGRITPRMLDTAGLPLPTFVPEGLVSYRSSAPAVVDVDANGVLTARALGTATITVEARGLSSSVEVSVVPPLPSAFDIELRALGDSSYLPREELQKAVARWRRVIVAGAPAQRVDLPAGSCGGVLPAISQSVEHLLVFVSVRPIDDKNGIIASATACAVREGTRQPVVAWVELDADDIVAERVHGTLEMTIAHELGHTLGFGNAWWRPEPSLIQIVPERFTYLYLGAAGRAAAANWGAIASADAEFPLENRGGSGSAASHWYSGNVGERELMTAFGSLVVPQLSIITASAMRDLGYIVDDTGADWTYAPLQAGPMAARISPLDTPPPFERLGPPPVTLGADGRPIAR